MREMKDSGIEWIGKIPMDWPIRKIGQMYYERRTKVNDIDFPPLSVTMKGVLPQIEGVAKTDAHDSRKLVLKGDFAINSRSDRRGACGIADRDGSVSLINIVLQPREGMNPSYLNWLFHTSMFADEFYRNGQGIVDDMWTTKWNDMKRISIPFPELDEQSRIASFLDSRIAKIDDSIARYKALSDKLDEYRKAMIMKAVTQGIRGERPMKDSSVSWIECIPEDWINSRLKALFRFGKGLSITKEDLVGSGYPVISYGQIHAKYNNGVSIDERLIRFVDEDHISEGSVVGRNDMIFADTSEDLEGCGNCVYIDTDFPIYGGYHTIILRSNTDKSNKYIAYLCKTDMWRCQIRNLLTDVKLFSISQKALKNTTIILPPEDEQAEIVAYLDKKCSDIDSSKEKIEAVVKKLEEYKKSLIYNAVTGKIEC